MSIRISFIGAGNVATHLALGFEKSGASVVAVVSRHISSAQRLAGRLADCRAFDDPAEIQPDMLDFIVIAASDDSLDDIAARLPYQDSAIVVHTAGSRPADVLSRCARHYGVLYPLQTFSRDAALDLATVPFFTEASDETTQAKIDSLARMISPRVGHADSAQRRVLHIAGVFSCNFVTYMFDCAARVLREGGYDFDVIEPLIRVTLDKVMAVGPHDAQTGPARRGDTGVMDAHMRLLPPELAEVYRLISGEIMKSHCKQ